MKPILVKYVRSLAEREPAKTAPETRQDLGTLLCWILERHDFRLRRRTFRYTADRRETVKGEKEFGIDIVASRHETDGEWLYCFVMKQGNVGSYEWSDQPGTLLHDLRLAAGEMGRGAAALYGSKDQWRGKKLVAVHNGDVNLAAIGSGRDRYMAEFGRVGDCQTDWWDADQLVDLAMSRRDGSLDPPDWTIFPPESQPFVRLALDSLRKRDAGAAFDLQAVDMLLDFALPRGGVALASPETLPATAVVRPTLIEPRPLYRIARELALFVAILQDQSARYAQGNALPAADSIERIVCRLLEHARRLPEDGWKGMKGEFQEALRDFCDAYVNNALVLARHLEPVLDAQGGLALMVQGEEIDYRLRVFRLLGILAAAAHVCPAWTETSPGWTLLGAIIKAAMNNPGAVNTPITDDQIIELTALWTLLGRLGGGGFSNILNMVADLLDRLLLRRAWGFPLPALYQRASFPQKERDLQILVDAYAEGRLRAPEFIDDGSTIAPAALYLALGLQRSDSNPRVKEIVNTWFEAASLNPPQAMQALAQRGVHLQTWQPPDDADHEWYGEEILYRGNTTVYDLTKGPEAFVRAFEEANPSLPPSFASSWEMPGLDWFAWKLFRTTPPMALLCEIVKRGRQQDDPAGTSAKAP